MSTINEIVRELAERDPNATPEAISRAIVQSIQDSIPDIIFRLSLPSSRSAAQRKLQEIMLKRMRSGRRAVTERNISERETFLGELHYMRYRLDGHGSAGTSIPEDRLWDIAPPSVPEDHAPDGQPSQDYSYLRKPANLDSEALPTTAQRLHPYSSLESRSSPGRVRSFAYQENFAQKLLDVPYFATIAKTLEEASRDYAERSPLDWTFEVLIDFDVEIPSWKRFVMKISIPTADANEKIRAWDELDHIVRRQIASLAEGYPDNKEEIIRFSKSLYLRMEVS